MIQRKEGGVRRLSGALVAVIALAMAVAALADYPKPAPVPYRWELEFEPGALRLYSDSGGNGSYWYFTYTVTNRSGADQLWAPKFTLFTDAGEIIESGRNVPASVTEGLLKMLGNELMEDQNAAIGDILQGKENAKEGLVIWPAKRLDVNEMSLFVGGISGETARVKNHIDNSEIILRKTLQRNYLISGNAADRGGQPADLVSEEWVLR